MVRVQLSYQYDSKVEIAKVIPRKKDLIVYKSPKEILFLMYLNDPRISSNQEVLKLVKELRGGSWGLLGTAAFLGLIILIFSMGECFVPNNLNPDWGLERPNPFQLPASDHRYPPYYDLFFPSKTCYADRPGGSAIKIANGQKGSISKQGKKIGAKIVYQQNYWSHTTKTSELENINPTASLPQSPNNVLGAVDNFDVPSSEKAFMKGSVLNGSRNNTNIIFLNNN